MNVKFRDRQVSVDSFSFGSDSADSWIEVATWTDTGEELEDGELDSLSEENLELIHTAWYEWMIGRAEDAADMER